MTTVRTGVANTQDGAGAKDKESLAGMPAPPSRAPRSRQDHSLEPQDNSLLPMQTMVPLDPVSAYGGAGLAGETA